MSIRAARASDRSGLLDLWLDLVEHHRRLDPDYPTLPGLREALLREIDRGLAASRARLAVAEEDGALVGFVFAELGRDARLGGGPMGSIHELFVAEQWRTRGVGSALMDLALRFLDDHGARGVSVRVETPNQAAQRFWSRRGFQERARILLRD